MRPETLAGALAAAAEGAELVIGEGVMGLFDGAPVADARGLAAGSTAQLAALTGWPVVLVVDCRGMGASVAALARGFAGFHPAVAVTRSEEHTSELQSLMRISYAVFCLKKKKIYKPQLNINSIIYYNTQ